MSVLFRKGTLDSNRAAVRLEIVKKEYHYDPVVRPGVKGPDAKANIFPFLVCKLSNPFEDETVFVWVPGSQSFSSCSCEFEQHKHQMCFHIAAVLDYVEINPLPVVTFESPGLRITETPSAVIFACKRSPRELDAAMRPDPPRRCGCGKTIKEGFRCKACQKEWEMQKNFDAVIEKDKSDLFG